MSSMEAERSVKRRKSAIVRKQQELLTEEVCDYLAENMDKKVTIGELSKRFHISATQLKCTFKEYRGVSLYAYQRQHKMQAAARDIRKTNDAILKIAGKYGYENGSKFAKAFKDTMGMSPSDYRNQEK